MAAKQKPYLQTAVFGALSIGSYVFLFMNVGLVNDYFIRGGVYATLPIATALYFSLIHGAFASYLLSVAGIKAKSDH